MLQHNRTYQKIINTPNKIVIGLSPRYLTKYLNLKSISNYQTRSSNKTIQKNISAELKALSIILFPFCVREWNKLDCTMREAESIKPFNLMLKNFLSLNERSLFSIYDPVGVKLFTRLQLQLSHLNEHKICHNCKDCMSRMCNCGAETEATSHFFLALPIFCKQKTKAV